MPISVLIMRHSAQSSNRPLRRSHWWRSGPCAWIPLGLLLLILAGCQGRSEAVPNGLTPQATALTENSTAQTTPQTTPDDQSDRRLVVVWVPDFMVTDGDSPTADLVNNVIVQFEQAHPNTDVELVVKQQNGAAAMLSYLRSAQKVAPAILPDAALLDTQDLWRVVDIGLAQPLEAGFLPSLAEFYPSARAAVEYQGNEYGVPYALDLIHTVGAGDRPPVRTWEELLNGQGQYIFAGADTESAVNPTLLLQFLAAGGQLREEAPATDPLVLEELFRFYAAGRERGIIPSENATLAESSAVWDILGLDNSTLGLVSAQTLLNQHDISERVGYASIPSASGDEYALTSTYAFAVLTGDPERLTLVRELIAALLEPTVHGKWSQFTGLLPSTPAALAARGAEQPYDAFLDSLLAYSSEAIPNGRLFYEYARRLQSAQHDVLSGRLSVEEALAAVLSAP